MARKYIYGVDLGTGTAKIYDSRNDRITGETNMVAVRNEEDVFAIGNDAYEMFEKNPEDIRLIRPMNNGRIQNVLMTEAVLHTLLRRTANYVGYSPVLYFAVPVDMTEIERRAYSTVARKGRFRRSKIFLIEKPIADAIDFGIPILHTHGAMILNIGETSTEVSVIADRRVIMSRTILIGGSHFTEAIVSGVRRKNGFLISSRTAERLKITLADLGRDPVEGCKVQGIDTDSGLPRDGIVSSYNVSVSVADEVRRLLDELNHIMERIPPQIRDIIKNDGIYLTGGGARTKGIDSFIGALLNCPVAVSPHYELSTVYGLREIMNRDELQHWAYVPGKKTNL